MSEIKRYTDIPNYSQMDHDLWVRDVKKLVSNQESEICQLEKDYKKMVDAKNKQNDDYQALEGKFDYALQMINNEWGPGKDPEDTFNGLVEGIKQEEWEERQSNE